MAFPDAAISLDTFARPSNGLGGNWGTVAGYETLHIINDNSAGPIAAGPAFNYWAVKQFPAHQEVYAVVAATGRDLWLGFRLQSPGTTPDGYRVECRHISGYVTAYLVRINTEATIGTGIAMGISALAVGDAVGVNANGSTITLYYRPVGGAWSSLGTWTDSSVSAGGYIGLGTNGWPTRVYVATTSGGIYHTSSFTAPDDNTQPVWAAVNGGLGALTIHNIDLDPFDRIGRQICLTSTEETCYIRYGTGNWQPLITQAQVRALTHISSSVRWVTCDRAVPGRIWVYAAPITVSGARLYWLYTDNDGVSWTVIQQNVTAVRYALGNLYASGNTLWCTQNSGLGGATYVLYSNDMGATWSNTASLGSSVWTAYISVNPVSGIVYTGDRNSDLVEVVAPAMTSTILQAALNLGGAWGDRGPQSHWSSANQAGYQRVLASNKLYTTLDAWATVVNSTPAGFQAGWNYNNLVAPLASAENWMILGPRIAATGSGQTHIIFTLNGDTGTPVGKAGADVAGGVDSIPTSAGGVTRSGIAVVR